MQIIAYTRLKKDITTQIKMLMTFAKTAYLFDTKRIMYLLPHFCLHYLVYATCISSQDHLYPELIYLAYATCISFDSLAKQGGYYFNICMGASLNA